MKTRTTRRTRRLDAGPYDSMSCLRRSADECVGYRCNLYEYPTPTMHHGLKSRDSPEVSLSINDFLI